MKYKFQRGDLVKNKYSVIGSDGRRALRDQKPMGIVIEDVGIFSGRQIVKVKWITSISPEEAKNLCRMFYSKSLDLVARASK